MQQHGRCAREESGHRDAEVLRPPHRLCIGDDQAVHRRRPGSRELVVRLAVDRRVIAVIYHGFKALGAGWEERKIKRLMEEEESRADEESEVEIG